MASPSTVVYGATLSRKAKLITYGVGYGVGLGVPVLLAAGFHVGLGEPWAWVLPVPFALTLIAARAFRPIGYRVRPAALEILQPMGPKTFEPIAIAAVNFPAPPPPGIVIGLVRSEGFYGAWGSYWCRAWGRFRVYVTDDANRVELRLEDGARFILSPDDPEAFVRDVQGLDRGEV